jgi:hypothetical protein
MSRPSSTLDRFRSVAIETRTSFRTSVAPARMPDGRDAGASPSETAPAGSAPSILP